MHKYLYATRKIIEETKEAGLLPVYNAGFVNMDKQYLTIGLNGIVEAAEYLGINPNNNEEYKKFLKTILKTIYEANREASEKYGCRFNTEFVPAESLGVKNANWDFQDGYEVPRGCYNSYFYPVKNDEINIFDKMTLHGKEILQYLDGGSALHLNLEHIPTKSKPRCS